MKKTRKTVQIGLGASSILMIFVVLCMMILSVLSYSRAKQHDDIAKREVSYEEEYAIANTKAEILYRVLMENYKDTNNLKELLKKENIKKQLQEDITYTLQENILDICIIVNKQQQLNITLHATDDEISLTRWKLTSTGGQSNDYD